MAFDGRRLWGVASMRPQHITAENFRLPESATGCTIRFNEAAAYHCGKRASAGRGGGRRTSCFNEAAAYHCGKPRLAGARIGVWASFNEAAAYHCGKPLRDEDSGRRGGAASMRPQHITAENCGASSTRYPACGRFNEAAAYHCGKLPLRPQAVEVVEASMRPQHITAENVAAVGAAVWVFRELQ